MKKAAEKLKKATQEKKEELKLVELFRYLSDICRKADKPLVLMIDEADSAVNNQVFLDFLSQLRGYYIDREDSPTFQSVILTGVYDVKNLKRKFRPEEEHKELSGNNLNQLRRIFLRECCPKIRRIAGYVTDFWAVLSEKKTSKWFRLFPDSSL